MSKRVGKNLIARGRLGARAGQDGFSEGDLQAASAERFEEDGFVGKQGCERCHSSCLSATIQHLPCCLVVKVRLS